VLAATQAVRVVATADGTTTILDLSVYAKGLVPADRLTPQEVLLANALIDLVVVEVADKLPDGSVLDANIVKQVHHYLDQVDVAARLVANS